MKVSNLRFVIAMILVALCFSTVQAQGVSDPLTNQGMGQFNFLSARTRAMGGSSIAVGNDLGAMFSNPASLTQMSQLQVQLSGYWVGDKYYQSQRWNPNRFYADMSLMFENKLGGIKDPDVITNPTDKIHRPFDTLSPDWSNSAYSTRPATIAIGIPFELAGLPFAVGLGYSEVANLNHYYQNNNAISPNLGQYRPQPIPLVTQGDTMDVDWYQFIRERKGSVNGITPVFSCSPLEDFHLGLSLTVLTGSSDDNQFTRGRGKMRLLYNAYLLDSANYRVTKTGSSSYSGTLANIGIRYADEYYAIGASLKLPATITREWDEQTVTENSSGTETQSLSGEDKLELPLLYTFGVALYPTEKWNIGIDYAIQNYSDVIYTTAQGVSSNPWVSSNVFRIGAEFKLKKWLDIRFGAREEAEVFASEGEGVIGEPARGSAYSAGFGIKFEKMIVNVSAEYGILKYNDLWQSNVNTNTVSSYACMIEIGYKFDH